ncbi:MAG: asparaginase, partial [Pseudomonadota bacterium]
RGGVVESYHRGVLAIAGPDGDILLSVGDVSRGIFPRSAIKIFQAIPLIESGAADAFCFDQRCLALACASHGGETRHAALAAEMLEACSRSVAALECGAHKPMNPRATWELAKAQGEATPLHNNCSGKHAGMIATAVHLGENPTGYVNADHPVQKRIRKVLSTFTEIGLDCVPCGTDGCSVPTWEVPVDALARAMASLASGRGPGTSHADAGKRLLAACIAEPELTSGTGRACAEIMHAVKGAAYVKTGAEGVYCGAVPKAGIGIALKIDDGATRASEVTIAATLAAILPQYREALAPLVSRELTNWRGVKTGTVEPSDGLKSALSGF